MDVLTDPDGVRWSWIVPGPTLRVVLDRRGRRLAPADALAVLKQLSAAVEHVWACGVVHRDIKPANVFLTLDGG